ncbi:MAG: DUF2478 domain-containing protein [bacterium]|nr:DUF2478 domain-containing protein [bacterium]
MPLNIVSGERGAGKTGFLEKLVARATAAGRTTGGVLSPAVFEAGQRCGYDLIDPLRGTRQVLARVAGPLDGAPTVGMYRFCDAAVEAGCQAIISAVRSRVDVVVVDEVGPLELRGEGWAPALEIALNECDIRQELFVVVRPSLVGDLPARFPAGEWAKARRIAPPWPEAPDP